MNRSFYAVLCLVIGSALTGCSGVHTVIHSGTDDGHPSSSPAQADISSSANVVKVRAANVSIPAGGNADATVTLSISPGYHINANPATFSYLIPTAVNPGKAEGIIAGKPVYPVAQKKKFQFAEEPLAVYQGEVQIRLPLRVEANVGKGAQSLPIDIRVQACDSEKCYAPDTLKTTIAVAVK
jgi:thiol:disulfide interchange protein DsbD